MRGNQLCNKSILSIACKAYNGRIKATNAPVAQWIEHPPPKGRVTRSIRVEGATTLAARVGARQGKLSKSLALTRILDAFRHGSPANARLLRFLRKIPIADAIP